MRASLSLLAALCLCPAIEAQQPQIQLQQVQKNIWLLSANGANITVQTGKDGVLIVDTAFAPLAPAVMAEIKKLSKGHVRYIINTHMHPDHVGGNSAIAKLVPVDNQEPLSIIAQANVLNRLTSREEVAANPALSAPGAGLPVDEYETPSKDLHFNGEAVIVMHEPKAHTDGDSMVLFRGSDVISTGDIFTPGRYPFIDIDHGGSVLGEISALNHLLELTVPADHQEGGTYVIPGHGRVCDEADVVEFRDMIAIVTDRVKDLLKKGRGLAEVKAAKPTEDYDTEYGNGDRFVESVYKSLGGK